MGTSTFTRGGTGYAGATAAERREGVRAGTGGAAAFRAKQEASRAASIKKYGSESVYYKLAMDKYRTGAGGISQVEADALNIVIQREAEAEARKTETLEQTRARMGIRDIEELKGIRVVPRAERIREERISRGLRQVLTGTYTPTQLKSVLAKLTPKEKEEWLGRAGITDIEQIEGKTMVEGKLVPTGKLLQRITTKEGEIITTIDPTEKLKAQAERSYQRELKRQEEEIAKMTKREYLVKKFIPKQVELVTSKIKGKPSFFKTWALEAPVGFTGMVTQLGVGLTQKGLVKEEIADPMAKYYMEELPKTPEGRKELYTQAAIMAALWGTGLAFKKYTTGKR